MDSKAIIVYCQMTTATSDNNTCGDGGWTLVMKIDGNKVLPNHSMLEWPKMTLLYNTIECHWKKSVWRLSSCRLASSMVIEGMRPPVKIYD